jgi:hypothetical protein
MTADGVELIQFGVAGYAPEFEVGILAIVGLCLAVGWLFVRWLFNGPVTPDPWDAQVSASLTSEDATPLCCHCLAPHDASADFCAQCGAPVGQYTNWLPFPYLFSIGQALRLGTAGEYKRSRLTFWGFILFSIAEYTVFAPVYWFMFLLNLHDGRQTESPPPLPSGQAG